MAGTTAACSSSMAAAVSCSMFILHFSHVVCACMAAPEPLMAYRVVHKRGLGA